MIRLYKQAIQRYMSIGVLKSDSFKISAFCKIAMLKSFSLVTKGLFQKYFPGNFDICLTKAIFRIPIDEYFWHIFNRNIKLDD